MAQQHNSWLSVKLDGVDEYAKATSPAYATDSKTGGKAVAIWFKQTSALTGSDAKFMFGIGSEGGTAGFGAFFYFGSRYHPSKPGDKLDITIRPTDGTNSGVKGYRGSTNLVAGTQYLAIFQTDGSTTTMYLGSAGTLNTETVTMWSGTNLGEWFSVPAYVGTNVAVIGVGYTAGAPVAAYTDNNIDQIMIFNDDLTSDERTALYNGGKPINPFAVGLGSKVREFIPIGDIDSSSSTINSAFEGTNFTTFNLESTDITSTNYY